MQPSRMRQGRGSPAPRMQSPQRRQNHLPRRAPAEGDCLLRRLLRSCSEQHSCTCPAASPLLQVRAAAAAAAAEAARVACPRSCTAAVPRGGQGGGGQRRRTAAGHCAGRGRASRGSGDAGCPEGCTTPPSAMHWGDRDSWELVACKGGTGCTPGCQEEGCCTVFLKEIRVSMRGCP